MNVHVCVRAWCVKMCVCARVLPTYFPGLPGRSWVSMSQLLTQKERKQAFVLHSGTPEFKILQRAFGEACSPVLTAISHVSESGCLGTDPTGGEVLFLHHD